MSTEIVPRCSITIRPGTAADIPFIDALQKKHSKMVGFMPRAELEGKIAAGHVLIAEGVQEKDGLGLGLRLGLGEALSPNPNLHPNLNLIPLGYCIGNDRYFKRDELGVIYQLNVVPTAQRKLIGATLIKAMFERAAYGCKLFCLWCAQDIAANHFW